MFAAPSYAYDFSGIEHLLLKTLQIARCVIGAEKLDLFVTCNVVGKTHHASIVSMGINCREYLYDIFVQLGSIVFEGHVYGTVS